MASNQSVINNSNAYGYARNVIAPVIVETLKSTEGISNVDYKKPTNVKDEIKLSFKEGRKKTYAVLAYQGSGDIKLSQYHMYNPKGNGIAFIKNSMAYFVELDVLQANWSNIMTRSYMYTDGSNMRATMTCGDPEKICGLASKVLHISDEQMEIYIAKSAEYI